MGERQEITQSPKQDAGMNGKETNGNHKSIPGVTQWKEGREQRLEDGSMPQSQCQSQSQSLLFSSRPKERRQICCRVELSERKKAKKRREGGKVTSHKDRTGQDSTGQVKKQELFGYLVRSFSSFSSSSSLLPFFHSSIVSIVSPVHESHSSLPSPTSPRLSP